MIAGMAVIALASGGIVQLPAPPLWLRIAAGACAVGFAARGLSWARYFGLFKAVRTTAFARYDTRFYSPLCLVLAAGFAVLALTAP